MAGSSRAIVPSAGPLPLRCGDVRVVTLGPIPTA